jgi:glutaredoxin
VFEDAVKASWAVASFSGLKSGVVKKFETAVQGNKIFNKGNCPYCKFVVTRTRKSHVKTWVSILRSDSLNIRKGRKTKKTVRRREMVNPTGEVMGVPAS